MKKNNSKNLIKTITVAILVFSVGTAFALNTAGAAGCDIMDKVVANAVAEQETAQQVETEPQTETSPVKEDAEETQETTAIKTEVAKEEIEASESAKEDEDVEETQATEPEVQVQDVTEEAAYIEEPKEEQPVVNTIVMEVIDRINSERVAAGAAPVVYDAVLNTMAQVRASENADNDYFVIENGKHKRPDGSNASSICSDYGQAGYFGEVMGRYQTSPAEIVDGWHNSATHYACMTSTKYNRVGVGIAADSEGYLYWVAIFMD